MDIILITPIYNKYSTNIQFMEIINKSLQPTVKEALLSLGIKSQCLQFEAHRARYVRGEIRKIKIEDITKKYKTKVENGKINVWRIS